MCCAEISSSDGLTVFPWVHLVYHVSAICTFYLISSSFSSSLPSCPQGVHRQTAQQVLEALAYCRRCLDDCFTLSQFPHCCKALMSNTMGFQGVDGGVVRFIYPTTFLLSNDITVVYQTRLAVTLWT